MESSDTPIQHPMPSEESFTETNSAFDFGGVAFNLPLSIGLGLFFLSGDNNFKFLGALVVANLFYAKFK